MEQPGPSHQGERFLHAKDSDLQVSQPVEHEQARRQLAVEHGQDVDVHNKPADKIADWLEVLERTHGLHEDPRVLDRIKESYHQRYVIKSADIPETVYQAEARIARRLGHGDIEITDDYRLAKAAEITANQEQSLDRWVGYLTSPDALYPTWAKYWAFNSLVGMGKFEKKVDDDGREQARFAKRTADTVAPFPPLNPRALALTFGAIEAKVAQTGLPKTARAEVENTSTRLSDSEFKQLLSGESFSRLYTQFLIELPAYSAEGLRETRGQWIKYQKGGDAEPLVDSLAGHPLEWCTANLDTAKTQLAGGDFYVFYSLDQDQQASIPRVAIRMDGSSIAEVRGIAPDQNLDPFIGEVVADKMAEFPDGEAYWQKAEDMQRVTAIEDSRAAGQPLSRGDLRFLYELDRPIQGFGYGNGRDPRIDQLLEGRDTRQDLAVVQNCDPEQISLNREEALAGTPEHPILFHYGNLSLGGLTSVEGLALPQTVSGGLYLDSLVNAEGLTLPQSVGSHLSMVGLTSAEGLTLPQTVGGNLSLISLTSAEGLTLPQKVDGNLWLVSLTSAKGLNLPQTVGGNIDLRSLTSAEGLSLPQSISGGLSLDRLTLAEGLNLPQTIGGSLSLGGLTSVEGLSLPQTVGGSLSLVSLTSAKGLTLPQSVGGNLDLSSLTSAEGLSLPQSVVRLDLRGLTNAEGLKLPQSISGDLVLGGLTSAEGLTLPQTVGGGLSLGSLINAEGLNLPTTIGGDLNLVGLISTESLNLPDSVGGNINLRGLTYDELKRLHQERPDLKFLI